MEKDTWFNIITIVTIIILAISSSMGLTWPMRVEETLIIILIWSLLGNNIFIHLDIDSCEAASDGGTSRREPFRCHSVQEADAVCRPEE